MNWNDPVARLRLIESVGISEYTRRMEAHIRASTVATVNGYPIRAVDTTQWGRLYHIDGLNIAFRTLAEATTEAEANPQRGQDHDL